MITQQEKEVLKKQKLVIICVEDKKSKVAKEIIDTLEPYMDSIILYKSMIDFEKKYKEHINDIIFMISTELDNYKQNTYFALFCERHSIKYVGNTSNLNFIATDKNISKLVFEKNNIETPKSIALTYKNVNTYSKALQNFNYPAIIKENEGGDSVNLDSSNIVSNYSEAIKVIKKLGKKNRDLKLLVEEFIDGLDLNFTLIGNDTELLYIFENTEDIDPGITGFRRILSHEIKHKNKYLRSKSLSNYADSVVHKNLKSLYEYLNGAFYIRLDARLSKKDNKIYFLEINSNPSIRKESSCYLGLKNKTISYTEFLLYIVNTAMQKGCITDKIQ